MGRDYSFSKNDVIGRLTFNGKTSYLIKCRPNIDSFTYFSSIQRNLNPYQGQIQEQFNRQYLYAGYSGSSLSVVTQAGLGGSENINVNCCGAIYQFTPSLECPVPYCNQMSCYLNCGPNL